jgi:hypothetical protein
MNYTYDFRQTPRSTNNNTNRPASPSQINTYNDMVQKRRIRMPVDIANMTYQQAFEAIGQARDFFGASDEQLHLIDRLIEQLQNGGVNIKKPDLKFMYSLTGGTEGTASKLIAQLNTKIRTLDIDPKEKPTEDVVNFMVMMFYCPEVNFDEIGVPTKISLELDHIPESFDSKGNKVELKSQLFRIPDAIETAKYISDNLTQKQCRTFLDKYRVTFNEWKNTRITKGQEERIRQLEERLADVSEPSVEEFAVNLDGELVKVPKKSKREYNPLGYTKMTTLQLRMISQDEASRIIEQMESELKSTRFKTSIDNRDVTMEEFRMPQTQFEATIMEMKTLNNFLHAMVSASGCPTDDIFVVPYHDEHEDITQEKTIDDFFGTQNTKGETIYSPAAKRKRNLIKDYISYIVDAEYVTARQLLLMAKQTQCGTELVQEVMEEQLGIKKRKIRKTK